MIVFQNSKLTHLSSFFGFFFVFVGFRWIKSLENGKFGEKYSFETTKFDGKMLEAVTASSGVFQLISKLEEIGIDNKNDQETILEHVQKLIKDDESLQNDVWE